MTTQFSISTKVAILSIMRDRMGVAGRRRLMMRDRTFEAPPMQDEPKSAAELKEIRLNRKLAQDAEGIKAMADIAAADVAIRKRTADLRALRLAKEAADRDKPAEPKVKAKKKKLT